MKYKDISLALAALIATSSCGTPQGKHMEQIKRLVGQDESFYKGGYGIISNDLYLRKGDPNNCLYSSSSTLFSGSSKCVDQLLYVKNPMAPEPVSVDMTNFKLPKEGILILFTSKFVYVVNLSSRDYFKYRR